MLDRGDRWSSAAWSSPSPSAMISRPKGNAWSSSSREKMNRRWLREVMNNHACQVVEQVGSPHPARTSSSNSVFKASASSCSTTTSSTTSGSGSGTKSKSDVLASSAAPSVASGRALCSSIVSGGPRKQGFYNRPGAAAFGLDDIVVRKGQSREAVILEEYCKVTGRSPRSVKAGLENANATVVPIAFSVARICSVAQAVLYSKRTVQTFVRRGLLWTKYLNAFPSHTTGPVLQLPRARSW